MKNKPAISLSKALIVENIKMYWYLPVLSFITYFMAGIFPLLVDDTMVTTKNHWYLDDCLNNWNLAYVLLLVAVPLIASMLMMSYLHNPVKAIAVHAQPFSRKKIFCSQTLTGWLMCAAPIVLMTLLYLMIANRGLQVFYWLAMSLIIVTFFYGLFTLAGALVGTAVMHLLLSGVFFGIVPLVVWIAMMYCESFLPGFYSIPDGVVDFMSWSNPLLAMVVEGSGTEDYTAVQIISYILAGIVMLLLAYVAYSRAKLEHVGDSMLYRAIEEIITWAITFVGMAAFGYFFYDGIDSSMFMLLTGMAFGTLLTFTVVKIVLERSIKIISRKNLASLGIFVIMAAVFTSITVYDITGFAKKVPAKEDVVSVSRYAFEVYGDRFYYSNFEDNFIPDSNYELNEPETIDKVIQLHKYIVENEMYDWNNYNGGVEVYAYDGSITKIANLYMTYDYTLKNGKHMQRRFEVKLDQNIADMLNGIITSKEFMDEGNLSEKIKAENVSFIQLHTYDSYTYDYILEKYGDVSDAEFDRITAEEFKGWGSGDLVLLIEDTKEIEDFLAALREDYYNRTYTLKASGEVVTGSEEIKHPLSIHGEIMMKKGSEGTRSAYTVIKNIEDVTSSSSSYQSIITEEIYAADPDDVPQASISFSVNANDTNTLEIMQDLYESEGYDYYAKRVEEYK
ncbi:MAG: hypothetical protein II354_00350 [Firmicutes bacterium]|nr:hypothetical protein [Bacillota bacterium]